MAKGFQFDPMKTTNTSTVLGPNILSPEQGVELQRLYDEFATATRRASDTLLTRGMESDAFLKADQAVSGIWNRIHDLLDGRSA